MENKGENGVHPDVIEMMFGKKMRVAVELFKKDIDFIIERNSAFFSNSTIVEEKNLYVLDFETCNVTPHKDLPNEIKTEIINSAIIRFK